jgi:hypothetical protein
MIEFTRVFDKSLCSLQGRKRGIFENCKAGASVNRNSGMMEYWNTGIPGPIENRNFFAPHSIIPSFQCSIS